MVDKKSLLEELWYGNLNPSGDFYDTDDKEIKKVTCDINKLHFKICQKLEEPISSKFDSYENARELQLQLMCKESFKRGFEMGLRLVAEALYKN